MQDAEQFGAALRSILVTIVEEAIGRRTAELRPSEPKKLMTKKEAAEYLRVSVRQIEGIMRTCRAD